jgi:hypothetical protein
MEIITLYSIRKQQNKTRNQQGKKQLKLYTDIETQQYIVE